MEFLFQLLGVVVIPFWLLMVFLPHWRWTMRIISSPWIAAPPVLIYVGLMLPRFPALLQEIANPGLQGIALLLGSPEGATIAWAHLLAFDLLIGRWVYFDSHTREISAWYLAPILILIFLFGPFGFLLYLLGRTFVGPKGQQHLKSPGA